MKRSCVRFLWAGISVLAVGVVATFCRGQGGTVSPLVTRPDLKVHSISAPGSASRSASISVSDVTTNIGNATATGSTSDIYICPNVNNFIAGCKVGSHAVAGIAAGRNSTWSGSVTVPAAQPLGTNYYIVVANGNRSVLESNYANNTNYVMIIINP